MCVAESGPGVSTILKEFFSSISMYGILPNKQTCFILLSLFHSLNNSFVAKMILDFSPFVVMA